MKRKVQYQFALAVCFLLACFAAFCRPAQCEVSAEDAYVASVGGQQFASFESAVAAWTDGSTLTLYADVQTDKLTVTGTRTLDLNGYTLTGSSYRRVIQVDGSLTIRDSTPTRVNGGGVTGGCITGGRGGVLVSDGASFYMTGGTICGNQAEENGGGVSVGNGALFSMSGGSITGNSTEGRGGGVYVGGSVTLYGTAEITGNTDGNNSTSNLYLPSGKTAAATDFSGTVGISMADIGTFAAADSVSGFFSDDLSYTVAYENGECFLTAAPIASITAQSAYAGTIYPTTELSAIAETVSVAAVNENGVEYIGEFTYELSGTLTVGQCVLTVTATGESGETAQCELTLFVAAPQLTGISAEYEQGDTAVYYDSDLSVFRGGLTVIGIYSDGYSRIVRSTAEETAAVNGETYITDNYVLSADLSDRTGSIATVSVSVQQYTASFEAVVSKYVIDINGIEVVSCTVVQESGAWMVPYEVYVPSLDEDILEVSALIDGKEIVYGALAAGVYTVTLTFSAVDPDNYELNGTTRTTTLTVNYAAVYGEYDEDGNAAYIITADGGIPVSWEFTVEEAEVSVGLEEKQELGQTVEITLRENGYVVTDLEEAVTVRLLLTEALRGKDVTLYRVLSDGTVVEVESEIEGDYIVFQTASVAQTQYVLVYTADNTIYIVWTVIFGVACVAGAGALIWYFVYKRKMKLKE